MSNPLPRRWLTGLAIVCAVAAGFFASTSLGTYSKHLGDERDTVDRRIRVRGRDEGLRVMKDKTLRVVGKEFPAKSSSDRCLRCRFILENEEGERCTVTCSVDDTGYLIPENLDTIVVGDTLWLLQPSHPDDNATLIREKKQS